MNKEKFSHTLEVLLVIGFMDLKAKYQNSAIGFLWSFLKPLLQFFVYYTIFGVILKVNSGGQYALQLFFGVIVWAWFAEGTTNGLNALLGKKSIITKIRTNLLVPILAAFLTSFMNYLLNLTLFFIVYLIYAKHIPVPTLSGLIIFMYSLGCISLFIIGCNLLLATLNTVLQDFRNIWELVLTYGVFLTPIIYKISIPKKYELLYYSVNLIALPLQYLKARLFEDQVDMPMTTNHSLILIGYHVGLLAIFAFGFCVHKKLRKYIIDFI